MTSNIELQGLIDKLGIKNFRGVIMRDEFKALGKPLEVEYGIYNTDDSNSSGQHWCCWHRANTSWFHFCPFGADPPKEFMDYVGKEKVVSSTFQIQDFDDNICGQLCVIIIFYFLKVLVLRKQS